MRPLQNSEDNPCSPYFSAEFFHNTGGLIWSLVSALPEYPISLSKNRYTAGNGDRYAIETPAFPWE